MNRNSKVFFSATTSLYLLSSSLLASGAGEENPDLRGIAPSSHGLVVSLDASYYAHRAEVRAAAAAAAAQDEKSSPRSLSTALVRTAPVSSPSWLTGMPTSAEWAVLDAFIREGILNTSRYERMNIPNDIYLSFKKTFLQFQSQPSKPKFQQKLWEIFPQFLCSSSLVFNTQASLWGGAYEPENRLRLTSREKFKKSYPEHIEPSFLVFQKITNAIFQTRGLGKEGNFYGILPSTGRKPSVGYTKDRRGYIPFPCPQTSALELHNIVGGEENFEFQRAFLVKSGEILKESGLIVSILPQNVVKFQVICGERGVNPFTVNKVTLRFPIEHPLFQSFKDMFKPEDLLSGRHHLIPFPETSREWQVNELTFLEDLIAAQRRGGQAATKELALIEAEAGRPVTDLIDELEQSLLRQCEQEVLEEEKKSIPLLKEEEPEKKEEKKRQGDKKSKKKKKNNKGKPTASPAPSPAPASPAPAPASAASVPASPAAAVARATPAPSPTAASLPPAAPSAAPSPAASPSPLSSMASTSSSARTTLPSTPASESVAATKVSGGEEKKGGKPSRYYIEQAKRKKKKGSQQGGDVAPLPVDAAVKQKARALLEKLKVHSRTKFRGAMKIMNAVQKQLPRTDISITRDGSHFAFHGRGMVSFVRPHKKKDSTISSKKVNYFTAKYIELLMAQEEPGINP